MHPQFSTSMVSALTGASPRMLDYWARTGLLKPSGREAAGKGSRRRYTFRDVVALLAICKLREGNCPLQKIRAAVRYLRAHSPEDHSSTTISRLTLLTDGQRVYMLTDEREVMDVVTRQMVWSVPLGMLIAEAQRKVEDSIRTWEEDVTAAGSPYRVLVMTDPETGDYLAECRRFPGLLERGKTAEEAVRQAADAIAALVAHHAHRASSAGVAAK